METFESELEALIKKYPNDKLAKLIAELMAMEKAARDRPRIPEDEVLTGQWCGNAKPRRTR